MTPPTRTQHSVIEEALLRCWDDGNATGLDGWIGPERGTEPDQHAIETRRRCVDRALADIPPIDDTRAHTCAPGQLRRTFDGGRNALLCTQCDTLLGYDPAGGRAEAALAAVRDLCDQVGRGHDGTATVFVTDILEVIDSRQASGGRP